MTTPTRYIRTSEGRLVAVPVPAPTTPEVEPVEEEVVEEEGRGTADEAAELTEVSEEDVLGNPEDNLEQGPPEEEDLSDLFMLEEPEPEQPRQPPPKRRFIRRTRRPYYPPPGETIIGPR